MGLWTKLAVFRTNCLPSGCRPLTIWSRFGPNTRDLFISQPSDDGSVPLGRCSRVKKKSHLSSSRWLCPHHCVHPANVCFHGDNADVSTQPAVWKVCFSSERLSWFVSQCVKTPDLLLLLFLLRLSIFGFFQSLLLVLEGKKTRSMFWTLHVLLHVSNLFFSRLGPPCLTNSIWHWVGTAWGPALLSWEKLYCLRRMFGHDDCFFFSLSWLMSDVIGCYM